MDDLARRHQQIQAELAQIGIALPGSLTSRTTRCQRASCHCHATPPVLHGPYPTWTRKAGGRSITKTLTPEDAERLRPYFTAHRRLRQLITELETISIELWTPTGFVDTIRSGTMVYEERPGSRTGSPESHRGI